MAVAQALGPIFARKNTRPSSRRGILSVDQQAIQKWKHTMIVTFAVKLPDTKLTDETRKLFDNKMAEGLAFTREYVHDVSSDTVILSMEGAPSGTSLIVTRTDFPQFHLVLTKYRLKVDNQFVFNSTKAGEPRTIKGSMTLVTNTYPNKFLKETAVDLRSFGLILQKKVYQKMGTYTVIAFSWCPCYNGIECCQKHD